MDNNNTCAELFNTEQRNTFRLGGREEMLDVKMEPHVHVEVQLYP